MITMWQNSIFHPFSTSSSYKDTLSFNAHRERKIYSNWSTEDQTAKTFPNWEVGSTSMIDAMKLAETKLTNDLNKCKENTVNDCIVNGKEITKFIA